MHRTAGEAGQADQPLLQAPRVVLEGAGVELIRRQHLFGLAGADYQPILYEEALQEFTELHPALHRGEQEGLDELVRWRVAESVRAAARDQADLPPVSTVDLCGVPLVALEGLDLEVGEHRIGVAGVFAVLP